MNLAAVFGEARKGGPFVTSRLHNEAQNLQFTEEAGGWKRAVVQTLVATLARAAAGRSGRRGPSALGSATSFIEVPDVGRGQGRLARSGILLGTVKSMAASRGPEFAGGRGIPARQSGRTDVQAGRAQFRIWPNMAAGEYVLEDEAHCQTLRRP